MHANPLAQAFYGWTVVAAAFTVSVFGWDVGFYGPPVYLKAVQDARGWPVSLVSGAVTLHFLAGVPVVANLPRLHRRFGLPAVTVAGAAALAFGVLGWALAREPWHLLVATIVSGASWVTLGAVAINAIVSPWFVRRRPAALASAYNGASIGGVVFSPLWVALIGWGGFPLAAAIVGAVMVAAVAVLATTILSQTPSAMGLEPDGGPAATAQTTSRSAAIRADAPGRVANPWADRAAQTLALGMALGLFAQIGLIAHLFSLLVPAMGAQGAGLAAGLATAAAIAGRTLVGWSMPAGADRRLVAAANYAVQMLGCGAFLLADGASVPLLLFGVVLVGLGIGNATSMPPLIVQAEFSKDDVPRIVALVTAVSQGTYAFAPAIFGLIREAAGAGGAATPALFFFAAAIQMAAALIYLAGRKAWRGR